MPKSTCSCGDDSQKKYINEAETFRTHLHLDNGFIPIFQNPSRVLSDLVKTTNSVSLIDRASCSSCDDTVSTQEKLKVRKKDRPTPYRVPYNHFRKITSCKEDCTTNVKIIKDISCNPLDTNSCPKVNYAISRLVDKNGVRNINNGGNYKNYLQTSGKSYYLNTAGILPENSVPGKIHTYKIGALENTVFNYNSGTQLDYNCRLNYSTTTSLTEKSFTLSAINTTTKKYSNPGFHQSGSVSSKAHLHRKKFKNRLAGQGIGLNGYNNCRNGGLCSIYMKPGPNTKLFMGKTAIQRCIPPRIRGIKQTCPAPPPACELSKLINPRFERSEYIEDQFNYGYLKITIDHCQIIAGDTILINFLGYSTTQESIFNPTSNTSGAHAVTSAVTSHTIAGNFYTTNLNITQLFVNQNTIYWVMPTTVGEGTTTIILEDIGDDNNASVINTTNGPEGLIYATVKIPRHIDVISTPAWTITSECIVRQTNGIGSIQVYNVNVEGSSTMFHTYGSFTDASIPGGTIHNPENIFISFKLINENFIQGDIVILDFYTSYSFGTGFFNTENYPSGITGSEWNIITDSQTNTEKPTLKLGIRNLVTSEDTFGLTNSISSASWNGSTSQVTIGSSTYFKQTLSLTIGSSPPQTSNSNEAYILYFYRAEQQTDSGTLYTNLFTDHPSQSGDVKFSITCNCFTGTGITDAYDFNGPCYNITNASISVDGSTEGMSLENYDITNDQPITPITNFVPQLQPEIVKFTFSVNNATLKGGDVISFTVFTDYGTSSSGFFTSTVTSYNWYLNERPDGAAPDNLPSIWLEQNNSIITGGIMSISLSSAPETSYNTVTNEYKQQLNVTIGPSVTSISTDNYPLTFGIFGNSNHIAQFPNSPYYIDYEIDSYCVPWGYSGPITDISYDPCSGRNGSLTNSTFTATGYGSNTGVIQHGNYIELVVISFTTTDAPLLAGDEILVKFITNYSSPPYNTEDGFFTGDNPPSLVTTGTPNDEFAIWFTKGTATNTILYDMISTVSFVSFSNNDASYPTEWTQVLKITLSSNFSGASSGDTWNINIMGRDQVDVNNITILPSGQATIDYELDLNCFTGTGRQDGATSVGAIENMAMLPIRFNAIPDDELNTEAAIPNRIISIDENAVKYSPSVGILPADISLVSNMGFITFNTTTGSWGTYNQMSRRYYDNPYSLTDFNTPTLAPTNTNYNGSGKERMFFSFKFTVTTALSGANGDGISITFKRTDLTGLANGEYFAPPPSNNTQEGPSYQKQGAELFLSSSTGIPVQNNNNFSGSYSITLLDFDNYSTVYDISSTSVEMDVSGNYNNSNFLTQIGSYRYWQQYQGTKPYCDVTLKFKIDDSETISANTNLILTFQDEIVLDNNRFAINMKRGTPTNFDLDISGHAIIENQLGYYSQDLSCNNFNNIFKPIYSNQYGQYYYDTYLLPSPMEGNWTITEEEGPAQSDFDLDAVPHFKYYHYGQIPKDSIVRIYFQVNGNEYFFNHNYLDDPDEGHSAITGLIHDWDGTWSDIPKDTSFTPPINSSQYFFEPRLCVHVSDGDNQVSVTDISVNTFTYFTQPGSGQTLEDNWADLSNNSSYGRGTSLNSPARKTFTDYLQFKLDQNVDASNNPLLIYLLDTTTNKNIYHDNWAWDGTNGYRSTIQTRWNTWGTLNPDQTLTIPVLNAQPSSLDNSVYAGSSYYNTQWKHHQIHLEVRHPDGYIIGSFYNKPMVLSLGGSQNTSNILNSG